MRRTLLPLSLTLLTACAADGYGSTGPSGAHIVPGGKADNYYSNVASEYEVTGRIVVPMTADEFADEATRTDLVSRRLSAVGLYLTAYVTAKLEGLDKNNDGIISDDEIFSRNYGYGSFYAMVRNHSIESVDVTESSEGYVATFTLDMGGPRNLFAMIPPAPNASARPGELVFELQMPEGASVDPDNVPRKDIRNFDARTATGPLETLELTARVLPDPANAYPDFAAYFDDGIFDITLFCGYDYNDPRTDIQEAEAAFLELNLLGFSTPSATTYAELTADSEPLRKRIFANGRPVDVEVRIFAEPMFTQDRRRQHDMAISEMAARDVFFYNGHAGPYYGFYLDANEAARVDYREFAEADLPSKAQLVVAQGCQTYSQYADMLYANPNKDESNLDVITTVNYSYSQGTFGIVKNLLRTDTKDNHIPTDFYTIVKDLNGEYWNQAKQVLYGVMGIEGNPQLHPYGNAKTIGQGCSVDSDCGDPAGNICADRSGTKACAAVALAASACPAGTTHGLLGVGDQIETTVCY